MSDRAELIIDGEVYSDFSGYNISADIYTAANAFSLDLLSTSALIAKGVVCQLRINDQVELTGVIDRVDKSYDKSGAHLRVSGRDMMGVLIDSHCEKFPDIQNKKVKELTEQLLANIPASHWPKTVVYQENFRGKAKSKKSVNTNIFAAIDTPQRIAKIDVGMSVFDVLHNFALSRGMLFWCEADGTMVFGSTIKGGDPDFNITCSRENGSGNNPISGELSEDISKSYSKVTAITQSQGQEVFAGNTAKHNVKNSAFDKSYPFFKPFVEKMTNDSQSPQLHADLRLKKMQHDSFQLSYRLPGHSQNGQNWSINRVCQVYDEVLGLNGKYLITARTFERTKQGTFTGLRLSLL